MGLTIFRSFKEALSSLKEDEVLYINSMFIASQISVIYKRENPYGDYVWIAVEPFRTKLEGLTYLGKEETTSGPKYLIDTGHKKRKVDIGANSFPTFFLIRSNMLNHFLATVLDSVEESRSSFGKKFRDSVLSSFGELITKRPFLILRDLNHLPGEKYIVQIKEKASKMLLEYVEGPHQLKELNEINLEKTSPELEKEVHEKIRMILGELYRNILISSNDIKFFDNFLGRKGYIWGKSWVKSKDIWGIDISKIYFHQTLSTIKRQMKEKYMDELYELEKRGLYDLEKEKILELMPNYLFNLKLDYDPINSDSEKVIESLDLVLVPTDYERKKEEETRIDFLVMMKRKVKDISLSIQKLELGSSFSTETLKTSDMNKIIYNISYLVNWAVNKDEPEVIVKVLKTGEGKKEESGKRKRVYIEVKSHMELGVSLIENTRKEGRVVGTEKNPEVEPRFAKITKELEREFFDYLTQAGEKTKLTHSENERAELREKPGKWTSVSLIVNKEFIDNFLSEKPSKGRIVYHNTSESAGIVKEGIIKSLEEIDGALKGGRENRESKEVLALELAKEILKSLAREIGKIEKEGANLTGTVTTHPTFPEKLALFFPGNLGEVDEEANTKIKELLPKIIEEKDTYQESIKPIGRPLEPVLMGLELCAKIGGKNIKVYPLGFREPYQEEGAELLSKALYLETLDRVMGIKEKDDHHQDKYSPIKSGSETTINLYKECLYLSSRAMVYSFFNQEDLPVFISPKQLIELTTTLSQEIFRVLTKASGTREKENSDKKTYELDKGIEPMINPEKAMEKSIGFKVHLESKFELNIDITEKNKESQEREGGSKKVNISYKSHSNLTQDKKKVAIVFPTKSEGVAVGFYIIT